MHRVEMCYTGSAISNRTIGNSYQRRPSPYTNDAYCIFPLISAKFRKPQMFVIFCFLDFRYFDYDAFTHHALLVLDAPGDYSYQNVDPFLHVHVSNCFFAQANDKLLNSVIIFYRFYTSCNISDSWVLVWLLGYDLEINLFQLSTEKNLHSAIYRYRYSRINNFGPSLREVTKRC